MTKITRRGRAAAGRALTATAVLVLAGGIAVATGAIPHSASGEVHLCYAPDGAEKQRGGSKLSIIDEQRNAKGCAPKDRQLVINQRGVRGTDGADGISGYEVVEKAATTDFAGDLVSGQALCAVGKRVIGGGWSTDLVHKDGTGKVGDAPAIILEDEPATFVKPGQPTVDAWIVQARFEQPASAGFTNELRVHAICANVG